GESSQVICFLYRYCFFDIHFFLSIQRQDISLKMDLSILDGCQCTDGSGTSTKQCAQEIPFYFSAGGCIHIIECSTSCHRFLIIFPAYDHNSALCGSRQHPVEINGISRAQVDPFQSSCCKNSPVPIFCRHFIQSCIHVTSQVNHIMIGVPVKPLRLTAYAAGG